MPRTLLVARHGETEWNRLGRFQGHTDVALNEAGRAQAEALAASLAGRALAAIVTSDLARARETGEIVSRTLSVPLAVADPDLRERGYGVFEGLTREECSHRYPDIWNAQGPERIIQPPGGEPHADLRERLVRGFGRVAHEHATDEGEVLVVCDGGAIRIFLQTFLGHLVPPVPNTAVYNVVHEKGRFVDAWLL